MLIGDFLSMTPEEKLWFIILFFSLFSFVAIAMTVEYRQIKRKESKLNNKK